MPRFWIDETALPPKSQLLLIMAGDKFKPEEATPLIVAVNVVPESDKTFVLIIGAIAVTPLVVLVIVFTALNKLLVVPAAMAGLRFNPADAIPLMVEAKVVPASDRVLV